MAGHMFISPVAIAEKFPKSRLKSIYLVTALCKGQQPSCSLSWLHFRSPGYQTRLRRTYIYAVASKYSTTNSGHQHSPCMYSKKTGYSPPGTSCRREKTKRRKRHPKSMHVGKAHTNMFIQWDMLRSEMDWIRNHKSDNGRRKINLLLVSQLWPWLSPWLSDHDLLSPWQALLENEGVCSEIQAWP